jgi:hypothetical protein
MTKIEEQIFMNRATELMNKLDEFCRDFTKTWEGCAKCPLYYMCDRLNLPEINKV